MNKQIIKEMVQERVRNALEPQQTNESVIAFGLIGGALGFVSTMIGVTIGSVLRNAKNRSDAKKAYSRFENLITKEFEGEVFKRFDITNQERILLKVAEHLHQDPKYVSQQANDYEDFDVDVRDFITASKVKPVLDKIKAKRLNEIFDDSDRIVLRFGDAKNANYVAIGMMIALVSQVDEYVKNYHNGGLNFDSESESKFKKMVKDMKQRYKF